MSHIVSRYASIRVCAAGAVAAVLLSAVSTASDVSADGSVIVGNRNSLAFWGEAFLWTAGSGMTGLGFLQGATFGSTASGVSGDGSVIVGASFTNIFNHKAFRWTAGTGMTGLGFLPGDGSSRAGGVSADGAVVVGTSYSSYPGGAKAFRWTADSGMIGLGFLPGYTSSEAYGVSGDGSVVVGKGFTLDDSEAFLWTEAGGMQRLWDVLVSRGVDPAAGGWTQLINAPGISLDGNTIVGWGMRNGVAEGFAAELNVVPEPASLNLFSPRGSGAAAATTPNVEFGRPSNTAA